MRLQLLESWRDVRITAKEKKTQWIHLLTFQEVEYQYFLRLTGERGFRVADEAIIEKDPDQLRNVRMSYLSC